MAKEKQIMKISNSKWAKMSNQERHDYLVSNEVKVKTITGLNGSAKVGSNQAMITCYVASSGGVTLSHPQNTRAAAMAQAEESIAYWLSEASK
jgi:hypothetical protein